MVFAYALSNHRPLHWPLSYILQIHAGPAKPQTAYSIRLIQYHHFLWQTAVISASSYVKAQLAFLNSCTKHAIFSDSGTFQRQNINFTFTANDTHNYSTWEKCDDNSLFESACRHDTPLMFANIHKTGEKLYYPVPILRSIPALLFLMWGVLALFNQLL
ncbi:uncharacterized protein VP01_5160g1 [Puccinia sorghi]|uniref:CxC1-like cysteine cluster associated with KDZ transposases domain-containing protein n=1 Tax=Puccinia sorghi TaxID=27349 RepID=A0A0L6UKW7_9BASI|nr:uncharacterized protein VP01_5160g1 [Puccinia sorghi]